MDVLFVNFPTGVGGTDWNLGFRYMLSYLRSKGFKAGLLYPSQITLNSNLPAEKIEGTIKELQEIIENAEGEVAHPHVMKSCLFSPVIDKMIDEIKTKKPLVIGFSVFDGVFPMLLTFLRMIKQNGINSKIVLGGHYPTFVHDKILKNNPEIDYVIRGEGEETIYELIKCIKEKNSLSTVLGLSYRENGKVRSNPLRPLIEDINSLPPPATDHYNKLTKAAACSYLFKHNEHLPVSTSRGCYGSCSYCSIQQFYRQSPHKKVWRAQDPKRAVDYMEFLLKKFGVFRFNIIDDSFLAGRQGKYRAIEFANEIIKRKLNFELGISTRADELDESVLRKLKEAGLIQVFLGIESNFQRGLDTFNKHTTVNKNQEGIALLKKTGLVVNINIIFFDPYLKPEEALENLHLIKELKSIKKQGSVVPFINLCIYQGIPLIHKLKEDRLLKGNYIKYDYKFADHRIKKIHSLISKLSFGLLSTLQELICGNNINIVRFNKKEIKNKSQFIINTNDFFIKYKDWFFYSFLAKIIEEYCLLSQRKIRLNQKFKIFEEMVLSEQARIKRLSRSLFCSLLGIPSARTCHLFKTRRSLFLYLGQSLLLFEIKGNTTKNKTNFFAHLNNLGFLSMKKEDISRHIDSYEDRKLSALEISCEGLSYKGFIRIVDFFKRSFALNKNTTISVAQGKEKFLASKKPLLKKIKNFCSREGIKLVFGLRLKEESGHCLGIAGPEILKIPKSMLNLKGFKNIPSRFLAKKKSIYHCSAGISSFFVDAEKGDIYACSQFGKSKGLKLGNVYKNQWEEIIRTLFVDACVDKKSICQDCWVKYLCGGGCPFMAFSRNRSIYKPAKETCGFVKSASEAFLKDFVSSKQ